MSDLNGSGAERPGRASVFPKTIDNEGISLSQAFATVIAGGFDSLYLAYCDLLGVPPRVT
jgi:hypothetical protein